MSLEQFGSNVNKTKAATPRIVVDMTLADKGDIKSETTYLARVKSARVIIPADDLTKAKIDLCVEVLTNAGSRLEVINDYLYTSPRSLIHLFSLLRSCGLNEEAENPALDLDLVCELLPGKHFGLITQERLNFDGTKRIEIAHYIPVDLIEETGAE